MAGRVVIGVMGPGETATDRDRQVAFALGEKIAEAGWVLLTGGRNVGVMEAANRGAKAAGGWTIGILPGHDRRAASEALDVAIMTGLGQARNVINVLSSQVVVACGMGAGTASEVALALKSGKPVILLNARPESQQFFQSLGGDRIAVVESVSEAIEQIHRWLDLDLK